MLLGKHLSVYSMLQQSMRGLYSVNGTDLLCAQVSTTSPMHTDTAYCGSVISVFE